MCRGRDRVTITFLINKEPKHLQNATPIRLSLEAFAIRTRVMRLRTHWKLHLQHWLVNVIFTYFQSYNTGHRFTGQHEPVGSCGYYDTTCVSRNGLRGTGGTASARQYRWRRSVASPLAPLRRTTRERTIRNNFEYLCNVT